MAYPTSVTQIGDLDADGVHGSGDVFLHFGFGAAGFIKRYTANVFGDVVAMR